MQNDANVLTDMWKEGNNKPLRICHKQGCWDDANALGYRSKAQPPEVDPEDLRKHNEAAVRLVQDLKPGESIRWADAVNTAASMAEIEDQ